MPLLRRPLQSLPRGARVSAPVPVLRRGFAASFSVQSERPIGLAAALDAAKHDGVSSPAKPHLFEEFSLDGRVAVVSGANRGLGLEMSLALAEAGARVYALDLPPSPGEEFRAAQNYVKAFGTGAKLEYMDGGVDVTDQKKVWNTVARIGDKEGRVDVGVAAAGILHGAPTLEYEAEDFQKVCDYSLFRLGWDWLTS
jgi:short chain dehydrogenase